MNNDSNVTQLLEKVKAKRKALGTKPPAHYTTNMVLVLSNGQYNLNTLRTSDAIAAVGVQLGSAESGAQRCSEQLGISVDCKCGDYTTANWWHDLRLRLAIINWDVEKKKLTAMEAKLKELYSEGARTKNELDDLASQLGM